ncbi:MAG: hypothetical protein ACC726_04615 [Chloroflexota bacterium]
MIDVLHNVLAYAAVLAVLVGIVWAAFLAISHKAGGPAFVRFQAISTVAFIVAAASGAVLLLLGRSPAEGLHFLYAAVAIGTIPLARSFLVRSGGRREAVPLLLAFLVLAAITFRLFSSG